MNFGLRIKCGKCGKVYDFDSHFCSTNKEYLCPNCAKPFPAEDFAQLHKTISALDQLEQRIGPDKGKPDFMIEIALGQEHI